MSFHDGLELNTGPSLGLRFARQALGLLTLYALVTSTAEPQWVAVTICALVAAYLVSGGYTPGSRTFARLVLRMDGSAIIHSSQGVVDAQQHGGGWSSRLCSVVVLREVLSGRRVHCLVCSSENLPDDYRRLLVRMRTAGSQDRDRPERWL